MKYRFNKELCEEDYGVKRPKGGKSGWIANFARAYEIDKGNFTEYVRRDSISEKLVKKYHIEKYVIKIEE